MLACIFYAFSDLFYFSYSTLLRRFLCLLKSTVPVSYEKSDPFFFSFFYERGWSMGSGGGEHILASSLFAAFLSVYYYLREF